MTKISEYEFRWHGWHDGARLPCSGYISEYGRSEQEARRKIAQRYPAISSLDLVAVVENEHK